MRGGEWEEKKLGEVCSVNRGVRLTRKDLDRNGKYPVYQNTNYPLGYYNSYNVCKNNPYVIIGGSAGLIGYSCTNFWAADDCAYFGKNDNLNKFFLYNTLVSKSSEIQKNVRGSSIPRLDRSVLSDLKIHLPSLPEQQVIARYFTHLDTLITSSFSRLSSLKQMKAASLQAMFPQEGETEPKIRFKGFEGEWEKVSFTDISYHAGIKNRDNLPLESYSISNEHGFIPQNEQFENGGTMTNANKTMYYIVSPKSFAYNPARINVGSLGYYDGEKSVIVSSLYEVFKTDEETDDKFLLYWFKNNVFKKKIEQFQEGGVRLYFFYEKLCKCDMLRPSLSEQQAIASYFTSLDKQISLQSQRLEKLKQIKAACLDNMFV